LIFDESPARDLYRLAVWGPYRHALGRLPSGWELAVTRRLGHLACRASTQGRQRIERNLARVFPERGDLPLLAKRCFGTHFANQYLPISFPRIDARNWRRYLRLEGLDHLDRALERGCGAVLMHPHSGPVQLPLHICGVLGYPVHQVGGGVVTGLSRVGAWATGVRQSLEAAMPVTVHDGKGFLRPVLRALGQGGVVMATCDGTGGGRELGRRTVQQVCGHPMQLPVSPIYLALKSGAPLLTLITRQNPGPGAGHVTTIGPPLALKRELPLKRGLEQGAQLLAAFLTEFLTRHPAEWHFWDHFEPGRFLVEETAS